MPDQENPARPPADSPSPGLVSIDGRAGEGRPGARPNEERRRVPRLNLTSEQFRLTATGKVYPVNDLSAAGMSLRIIDRADLVLFTVGAAVEGRLNLRREKIPVRARVRRVSADSVGCEFEGLEPGTGELLRQRLDPRLLGAELKPVPSADPLWYHGPSGTDLLAWREADGSWRRLLCLVLGTVVQWEEGRGASTGRVTGEPGLAEVQGVIRVENLRFELDERPDAAKMAVAKTLLSGSILPDALKASWIRRLGAPESSGPSGA